MVGGKRRDIGLGSYPSVSLAEARERAREVRNKVWQGIDPLAERAALRRTQAQAIPTFDQCARRFMENKRHEFRNVKHVAQWESTLTQYASPVIGRLPVNEVELPHIVRVLEPIWLTKTETASRLRGRIESVLAWATVAGFRSGDNPARWKGHLDAVFPKPGKVKAVEHHDALPYQQMPAFFAALREREGLAARMVEFCVLTAARSGEVRGARWNEIDLDAATWTIPGNRMKAGKEHRVPLAPAAVELLQALPREGDQVFTAPRRGQFTDTALTKVLRRMKVEATIHGMRSSFRDWAGETTGYPREVIEHALAHRLKDKAEAAYARGTLFDKRRELMQAWADYLDTVRSASDKVVRIRRATG
jgi:integrase